MSEYRSMRPLSARDRRDWRGSERRVGGRTHGGSIAVSPPQARAAAAPIGTKPPGREAAAQTGRPPCRVSPSDPLEKGTEMTAARILITAVIAAGLLAAAATAEARSQATPTLFGTV